jgi:hypothetical protein
VDNELEWMWEEVGVTGDEVPSGICFEDLKKCVKDIRLNSLSPFQL